jgi:hypothetical protein
MAAVHTWPPVQFDLDIRLGRRAAVRWPGGVEIKSKPVCRVWRSIGSSKETAETPASCLEESITWIYK